MRPEATTNAARSWTIMLADIIGLMLAFFVLSFSMRELVPNDPVSAPPPADNVAVLDAPLLDQLHAMEQERASSPSFAYLAAIIEANSVQAMADALWHDDTRLAVRLPGKLDTTAIALDAGARELLLTLAFLARRFDLDLTLDAQRASGQTIEQSLEQATAIRDWLAETAGLDRMEITFNRPKIASVQAQGFLAALNARPAQIPATSAADR
jgi:flagellar motor protein MotB